MTKQTAQSQSDVTYYEDLLLKRFRITESVCEEARKFNREHSINEATSNIYVDFTIHPLQKKYERWLRQCVNPSTKKFYTMEYLKAKQIVSHIDTPYDGISYPRIELYNLVRIKTQQGEFLKRSMMLYGLDINGKEISLGVDTADDHRDLQIEYVKEENPNQTRYMGDDEVPGWGRTIAKVRNVSPIWTAQEEGTLVLDTPFSEETVQEFAKYARGPFGDGYNGCALAITNEMSGPRYSYSIKSLEQFCRPFDELYEEMSRPKDKGVDVKELIRQLKEEELLGKGKDLNETGQPYK